jgi:hypothetical protein
MTPLISTVKMALLTAAGLTEPMKEAAKINIGAAAFYGNAPKPQNINQTNFCKLDADVTQQQRTAINARAPVFHNVNETSKMSKLASTYSAGTQQSTLHVMQQVDGYGDETMDQLEFVGIATDELEGDSIGRKQNRSHASTAVRVSGTITALHASRVKVPIMAAVRWQTPTKTVKITGVKPVHMPELVESSHNPLNRMRSRLHQGIKKTDTRSHKRFKELMIAIHNANGEINTMYTELQHRVMNAGQLNTLIAAHDGEFAKDETEPYNKFLTALFNFAHDAVTDDNRRNVGVCLGTKDAQINLLLGK